MATIMIRVISEEGTPVDEMEEGSNCPRATRDPELNAENKQEAIDEYGYRDPADDGGFRLTNICGNCGAYNQTEDMLECIGVDDDEDSLGYCQIFKFVCESMYTCDKWVSGGPIKTDLQNEYRGDIL